MAFLDERYSYRRTIHARFPEPQPYLGFLLNQPIVLSLYSCFSQLIINGSELLRNASWVPVSSSAGPGGPYQYLSSHEITWRDRQQFLESRGYMLRPRLRPGWTPSWLRTGTYWPRAEDSAQLPARTRLVDATRIADGKLVYIKQVQTNDRESRIASVLSSSEGPTNHSVPILDTFVDSSDESISYMVMSFLRILDEPPFYAVGEIVDFADQILEGLVFMHSKGVAHRDCSTPNLMMDATNMYPLGFHPVRDRFLDDVSTRAPVIPRSYVEVKYYFVDYGISSYFPPGSQRELVLGTAGRDQDVPELSDEVPYDPFKVDIFTIGNVFHQLFHENYSNCEFFRSMPYNTGGLSGVV
ncbi:hypothetical protein BC826DRAFT_1108366 [Russula brevipes]|nr:hypothetical protein BC826DRAFT_1108366 [Russula brevipes]